MGHMIGFVVIVILYAVIGFLAAAGTIFIARKIFAPKAEQILYAMFLIMVAAFYLAFIAYFGVATAFAHKNVELWRCAKHELCRCRAVKAARPASVSRRLSRSEVNKLLKIKC